MRKFVKRFTLIVMAACMVFTGLTFAGCVEETLAGEFYTLQEAYDNGWLTQEDLLSIAYHYNHGREDNEELMGEDYVPQPKTPETLSKQTEKSIKQTELDKYNNGREPGSEYYGTLDQVYILGYYGTYNGCVCSAVACRSEGKGEEEKAEETRSACVESSAGYEH